MKKYRMMAAGVSFMSLAAAVLGVKVWGDSRKQKRDNRPSVVALTAQQQRQEEEQGISRFTHQTGLGYRTVNGEGLFAVQLQPEMPESKQPRDIALLVDTSASQAVGPLTSSIEIVRALIGQCGPEDRISLWSVSNEPVQLTRGLMNAAGAKEALAQLEKDYPSGATNLPKAIRAASGLFGAEGNRSRSIILLGDGLSLANPLETEDRVEVASELVGKRVAMFAVPMGPRMDPLNLHGLATASGGRCVRVNEGDAPASVAEKLRAAVDVPVYYPTAVKAGEGVVETYPAKLPPLRSDVPTLVVGKVNPGVKAVTLEMDGTLGGARKSLTQTREIPGFDVENFFLAQMIADWKVNPERPALVQADRALALASTQSYLNREECLPRANWAMTTGKPENALRLYDQAARIDPTNMEARRGFDLARQVNDGKLPRALLMKQLGQINAQIEEQDAPKADKPAAPAPAPAQPDRVRLPGADGNAPRDGIVGADIDQVRKLNQVYFQKREAEVRRALSEASRAATVDEVNASKENLKQELRSLENDGSIANNKKQPLIGNIQARLQELDKRGKVLERDERERQMVQVSLEERRKEERSIAAQQDRIKERLRQYAALMNQAREDLAQKQAQAIRQDLINQGEEVPPAVSAAYTIAQRGWYYRQLRDLVRVREEKWLAVLYEVERSHIPFPDEPPVLYPDADSPVMKGRYKDWADLSKKRIDRYDTQGFGSNVPEAAMRIKDVIGRTIDYAGINEATTKVQEALDQLGKEYNISFEFNEAAFKAAGLEKPADSEIGDAIPKMRATLSSVIKKIISRIKSNSPEGNAVAVVRRDHIEITTSQFQLLDKVARAYPVADIVYGAPNSFAQNSVVQQSTLFGYGGSYGFAGQVAQNSFNGLGALQNVGAAGALGAGGGFNAGGGGGFAGNLGGAVGGQQIGGQLGVGAVGNFGQQGQVGQFGQNGGLGVMGQFGNQGAQFGLQGGNYADVLVATIRQLVGRPSDWAAPITLPGNQPADPLAQVDPNAGDQQERNQIGYFQPANALVIKGTSYIHTELYSNFVAPVGGANPVGMAAKPVKRDGALAALDKPVKDKKDLDPRKIWQEALAKGVDEPGIIIAVSDFLAANQMWDHAAEFLKADLRKGLVVKPWVYEALAIALRESGAAPEEIERAEVALADMEPLDAEGYLKASKGMASLKRYDRALAFCKQAAQLAPDSPQAYAQALGYAETVSDVNTMAWAAGNLLKQEWPEGGNDLQAKARRSLDAMASRLAQQAKPQERETLIRKAGDLGRRDLVVQLSWTGDADLDLVVKEPTGSTCSTLARQTPNGGTLVGDRAGDATTERYVAAEGFSGTYEISVRSAWGMPVNGKAQVRIIHHQGSPEQREEIQTVDLNGSPSLKVNLNEGRRKELAVVLPPKMTKTVQQPKGQDVFHTLRRMTEPNLPSSGGIRAGGAGTVQQVEPVATPVKPAEASASAKRLYQNRVQAFMQNTQEVTARMATETAGGRLNGLGGNLIDGGKPASR